MQLVGREKELDAVAHALEEAKAGRGRTLVISGEPGIGKTVFVQKCMELGEQKGCRVLMGSASRDSAMPFLVFSEALAGVSGTPLLAETDTVSFAAVFLTDTSGEVLAQATGGGIDPGTISRALRVVQSFVGDSFKNAKGHVGRMTFGDMTVLAERCRKGTLCGAVAGPEHAEMSRDLRRTAAALDSGAAIEAELSGLADRTYIARRDLTRVRVDSERNMLADRTVGALASAAFGGPVLLVLEDMHWADETALHVFGYLARSAPASTVVLATARPSESASWAETVGTLGAADDCEEIVLKGMDPATVRQLVDSSYSPNRFPPEFYTTLAGTSEGNPLFTVEMVAQMVADGGVDLVDGTYVLAAESYSMPSKVEDIVSRRLESLEPNALALAEYCSCLGPAFPEDLALSAAVVRDPAQGLEELGRAGIVSALGGEVAFKHAMFREAIYNSVPEKWRSTYHRGIGEHYETAFAGREDEVIYELARHFAHSGERAKAFDYCQKAGEKAETAFAIERAIEFFRWSLDALRTLKVPGRIERELELLERLGDLMASVSEFEAGVATYNDALALAGEADLKARLHRKIAEIYWKIGKYDETLQEAAKGQEVVEDRLERVRLTLQTCYISFRRSDFDGAISMCKGLLAELEDVPGSDKERGDILDLLGSAHHGKGDHRRAQEYYEEALGIMERIGDLRKMAVIHNNIGNIYGDRLQNDICAEYYDKAVEIFERIGDKLGVSVIQNNIGAIHHSGGEPLKALECYERSFRMARVIGDQRMISNGLGNLGATHASLGEFRRSIEYFEKAKDAFEVMDDRSGHAWTLTGIGSGYHYLGDLDLGIGYLKEGNAALEKIGIQWKLSPGLLYLADALLEKGELNEAEAAFERAHALAVEIDSPDIVADSLTGLAEISISRGDPDGALESAGLAETGAREAKLKVELASALRVRGKALALTDRRSESEGAFADAAAIYDKIHNKVGRAKLDYEQGMALATWGETEEAKEHFDRALEAFEDSEMKLWAERCREASGELETAT